MDEMKFELSTNANKESDDRLEQLTPKDVILESTSLPSNVVQFDKNFPKRPKNSIPVEEVFKCEVGDWIKFSVETETDNVFEVAEVQSVRRTKEGKRAAFVNHYGIIPENRIFEVRKKAVKNTNPLKLA